MSYLRIDKMESIKDFPNKSDQLTVMNRCMPENANLFFTELIKISFNITGKINKEAATIDIKDLLSDKLSKKIQNNVFYQNWIEDMANLCKLLCVIEKSSYISYSISSHRECRRYHIDNVPLRLLVTFAGQGTEWLPDNFADKIAYKNGESIEKIKNISAKQFIGEWDIAVFKGGPKGLLRRTPDSDLNNNSILMRLDHPEFWENIQRNF